MLDDADDDIADVVEPLLQEPKGDALSGAGLAGDHDVAAVSDAELDPPQEGIEGRRDLEGFDGDVRAEWVELQAVGLQKRSAHVSLSLLLMLGSLLSPLSSLSSLSSL